MKKCKNVDEVLKFYFRSTNEANLCEIKTKKGKLQFTKRYEGLYLDYIVKNKVIISLLCGEGIELISFTHSTDNEQDILTLLDKLKSILVYVAKDLYKTDPIDMYSENCYFKIDRGILYNINFYKEILYFNCFDLNHKKKYEYLYELSKDFSFFRYLSKEEKEEIQNFKEFVDNNLYDIFRERVEGMFFDTDYTNKIIELLKRYDVYSADVRFVFRKNYLNEFLTNISYIRLKDDRYIMIEIDNEPYKIKEGEDVIIAMEEYFEDRVHLRDKFITKLLKDLKENDIFRVGKDTKIKFDFFIKELEKIVNNSSYKEKNIIDTIISSL